MNKPLLFAAMCAALPACAAAQEAAPAAEPGKGTSQAACGAPEATRASSALPARASAKPEPQLGSVARNAWVPSHAETPSLRAMRAARAKETRQTPDAERGTGAGCPPDAGYPVPQDDQKRG
mgnify:CR=1 FL=1